MVFDKPPKHAAREAPSYCLFGYRKTSLCGPGIETPTFHRSPNSYIKFSPNRPLIRYIKVCCGLGYFSRYSDSLRAGRSGDRIPVGARFFALVRLGSGVPTQPPYSGYRVSFWVVKRSRRGVKHQPPFSAEVKERVDLYLYSASGPSWLIRG